MLPVSLLRSVSIFIFSFSTNYSNDELLFYNTNFANLFVFLSRTRKSILSTFSSEYYFDVVGLITL